MIQDLIVKPATLELGFSLRGIFVMFTVKLHEVDNVICEALPFGRVCCYITHYRLSWDAVIRKRPGILLVSFAFFFARHTGIVIVPATNTDEDLERRFDGFQIRCIFEET